MIVIALTLQRCEKFQEEGIDRKKKEFSAGEHREILMDWVPQALDRTSTGGKKLIQKEKLDLSGQIAQLVKSLLLWGDGDKKNPKVYWTASTEESEISRFGERFCLKM